MWFTETGGVVGYVTPNGAVTEYSASGRDPPAVYHRRWAARCGSPPPGPAGNYVYQISTGGALTQYVLPSGWILGDITAGPDGRVWFDSNDQRR